MLIRLYRAEENSKVFTNYFLHSNISCVDDSILFCTVTFPPACKDSREQNLAVNADNCSHNLFDSLFYQLFSHEPAQYEIIGCKAKIQLDVKDQGVRPDGRTPEK